MATTFISIDEPSKAHSSWQATDMTSPNAEELLADGTDSLIFNIEPYKAVYLEFVNKHATADLTVKIFVSNFDDPGATFSTDFVADSKWTQAKDSDGTDLSITVTADGTPANNEIHELSGRWKWMAISGANGADDYVDSVDVAILFVKREIGE